MKTKKLAAIIISIFCANQAHAVTSGAIANETLSAESLAKIAVVAGGGIEDASMVYHNPAFIGDMQGHVTLGSSFVFYDVKREASSGNDEMDGQSLMIPNFGITTPLADGKFGIGLNVVSPYGLKTKWKDDSNVRFVATNSELEMIDITPAVSYRPSDMLALGFGIDYFKVTNVQLEKKVSVDVTNAGICLSNPGLPGCLAAPTGTEAHSKIQGDGDQWGYHAGVAFSPAEKHDFGITYHSEVKMRMEGNIQLTGLSGPSTLVFGGADYKTTGYGDLFFPQNIQLGYAFKPNDKWHLEFDAAWYNWSANQEFKPVAPDATAAQKALVEIATPLQWKDVWSFALGASRQFNDQWKGHFGLFHLSAAVPNATFSPSIPDSDRYGFSLGPSFRTGDFKIDGAFMLTLYDDRTVSNDVGSAILTDIDGKYSANIYTVGLNASWFFGEKPTSR